MAVGGRVQLSRSLQPWWSMLAFGAANHGVLVQCWREWTRGAQVLVVSNRQRLAVVLEAVAATSVGRGLR